MKRREDLTTPRTAGRVGVSYDSDTFGRFSESIANFLGTARFLVWQTVVITVWILLNTVVPARFRSEGKGNPAPVRRRLDLLRQAVVDQ